MKILEILNEMFPKLDTLIIETIWIDSKQDIDITLDKLLQNKEQFINLVNSDEFDNTLNIVDAVISLTNDLELTKDEGLYIEKLKSRTIVYEFLLNKCFG